LGVWGILHLEIGLRATGMAVDRRPKSDKSSRDVLSRSLVRFAGRR
jgi:hypothetical protein